MFFGKAKPTVTPEDKAWVEDAFLWFEKEYSSDFLREVPIIEPTKTFFPIDFSGTEKNAEELAEIICRYMKISDVKIDLHYFTNKPIELADGIVTAQSAKGTVTGNKGALGTYREKGVDRYSIGIELELLKDPVALIATMAHELSHLVLLGQGRLAENDEELTDLNCIATGFGIFTCNSIFSFGQWQGATHQGWQYQRSGYIPEEVATYALALLVNYQKGSELQWLDHLNPSPRKKFRKNMRYLSETKDEIRFR